jgi:hypothetical protein
MPFKEYLSKKKKYAFQRALRDYGGDHGGEVFS